MDLVDDLKLDNRNADGPLRIPILDKMRDRGCVVFGKVESGTIVMGEKLQIMPHNK